MTGHIKTAALHICNMQFFFLPISLKAFLSRAAFLCLLQAL